MTNAEINDRATTIGNLALAAAGCQDGAAKLLIMQVAAHMADNLIRPRHLVDMSTGKVIPFNGGKA